MPQGADLENVRIVPAFTQGMDMLVAKAASRGPDWVNHLKRRGNGTINDVTRRVAHGEIWMKIARVMQRLFRPIWALEIKFLSLRLCGTN